MDKETVPDEAMFVSVVALGEIQAGIEVTREQDEAKAKELESWLDDIPRTSNVIDVDTAVFRRWAKLLHRKADHHLEDALIAATGLVFDLTVATRNTKDFKSFGVAVKNPFLPTQ